MSPIAATRPAATLILMPVMVRRRLTDGSSIIRSEISRSRTARSSPSRSSSRAPGAPCPGWSHHTPGPKQSGLDERAP